MDDGGRGKAVVSTPYVSPRENCVGGVAERVKKGSTPSFLFHRR